LKKVEYATMAEREKMYWWHSGRLRIIETQLRLALSAKRKAQILNVGCGTGGTVQTLEAFGQVDNVDVSDDAIKFMKKNGHKRVTKVNGIKLPFGEKVYDVVGAFDVLEHIDNHVGALKEWKRVIKDDGAIIITVPAYQWLWTQHDVSLQHKRRYTKRILRETAIRAGLIPDRLSYAIVFSLPLVVGFRFMNKIIGRKTDSETSYVNVPNWLNSVFSKILFGEAKMHKYITFPAGTSLVAILRKNGSNEV
jgi:SAM-dependent methyltransferase